MDHFDGSLTPEFAWKNDMLNEQRKTNELLTTLIEFQQPKVEVPQERKQRPGKKVDNHDTALRRRERN